MHKNGRGYTSRQWRNSSTLSFVKSFLEDRKIYSNGPLTIRFLTGRETVPVPRNIFMTTHRANEDYQEQLQLMCSECREGEAMVVYFNALASKWNWPSLEELESECDMPVLSRLNDGTIFGRYKPGAEPGAALDGDSAPLYPRQ